MRALCCICCVASYETYILPLPPCIFVLLLFLSNHLSFAHILFVYSSSKKRILLTNIYRYKMAYKMRPDSPVMNLQDEFSWGWGVPNWQDQWDGVTVPSEVHPVPPCQPSEYEGLKNNNKPSSNQCSSQAQRCLQRLGSLMNDSTFADLTLRCRSETFAVHRAVICPQSKFFEKSICGAFKVSRSRKLYCFDAISNLNRKQGQPRSHWRKMRILYAE